MAVAEQQVTLQHFLGSLQRDWNRPNLWQAHLNAFNTRGPPAAEVAIATAFSSMQAGARLGCATDHCAAGADLGPLRAAGRPFWAA